MSVTFEDLLARDGRIVYKTRGRSMEPMLRQDRDLVVIRVPDSRLKRYDVALYRRGSSYVLHRVVRVTRDRYLIRGDNTYVMESVPFDAVIGVLSGFQRKGRKISANARGYRIYVALWQSIYPLRHGCIQLRRTSVRAARKLGILPLIKRALGRDSTTENYSSEANATYDSAAHANTAANRPTQGGTP